jgi:hypothetical protein
MVAGTWYQIRVAGSLEERWWSWFPGFTVTIEPSGETVLTGDIPDHRRLLGVLVTLHELGHDLSSIVRGSNRSEAPRQLARHTMSWPERIASSRT